VGESAESALKRRARRGRLEAAAPAQGNGAAAYPMDECHTCGRWLEMVDKRSLYCADCQPEAAARG
jgi:hypothetical protein